jgi:hypothetical protein
MRKHHDPAPAEVVAESRRTDRAIAETMVFT